MSNLDYKEGRGDYYLAEGKREEREITSEDRLQVLKIATMRLREALDMERKTSSGNPMTPLSVAKFLSGPWLDYIAEPYAASGQHEHDPDKCDECQEMVMEALRD